MNFDEYESRYETTYAELAEIVKTILETAIVGTGGVPRPQSIQFRAKSAPSLKGKLQARHLLDSPAIENEIKDTLGDKLRSVEGDTGGRQLIGANPEAVVEVELGAAVALDIDTPAELAAVGGTLPSQ